MNRIKRILIVCGLSLLVAGSAWAQSGNVSRTSILGKEYYVYTANDGESLYGTAKKNGWDQQVILTLNPKLEFPLNSGDRVYYPVGKELEDSDNAAPAESGLTGDSVVTHNVARGETLYSLAKKYNTTVEDIIRENPDLAGASLLAGSTINVRPGTRNHNMIKESVTETQVLSLETYTAKRNDTWEKIAKKKKVDVKSLREANPSIRTPQKDDVVVVPRTVTVTEDRMVPVTDPRETTIEGRKEIFAEVQQKMQEEAKAAEVRIAVILDDIQSNKDMEFMRGFLAAVNELKDSPYRIVVTAEDGTREENDILMDLNSFEPTVIFTTSEKSVPAYANAYASGNDCYVINVFDTKNTDWLTNRMAVQLLTPSDMFNREVADFIADRFKGRQLLVVGEVDGQDAQIEAIVGAFNPSDVITLEASGLSEFEAADGVDYLVLSTATKKSDAKSLLEDVTTFREKFPLTEVSTIGRPNWVTFSDDLAELLGNAETFVPSRFYFDAERSASRDFINDYRALYSHTPIKSYPVYAVTGYDVAGYFIPLMHSTSGNLSEAPAAPDYPEALQNDFMLVTPDGASGLVNPVVYMVKFNPFGNVDKILVK